MGIARTTRITGTRKERRRITDILVVVELTPSRGATMEVQQALILRKNAIRLLPILTLAYTINYLDRTNISFAALTMNKDIGLTATQYGRGAGIFFLAYCLFEVPSNLALYRFGARLWIARIMITWGLLSIAMVLVGGAWSFYVMRFLLGAAEAGFFPGVAFYLAFWFPAQYRARILAGFLVAIPFSTVIGAPLSGLLLELDGIFGLAGWKWLLILEGLPAVVFGFVVAYVLADRPETAGWLDPQEKATLTKMLGEEPRERVRTSILEAIKDPRVIVCALVQFGFTLGSYGILFWLPQIIKASGLPNMTVSLLTAIPYAFATAGMIWWALVVDKSGKKISNLAITCGLGAIGLIISVLSDSLVIGLSGLTIALIGITSARAVFWTIPTRFVTGVGAASGLAFINSIGVMGGYFGPELMGTLKDLTGGYITGLLVMAGFLTASTVLAASLKLLIKVE
jgi:MFS transporter, ACS family, tartrate transporter